MNFRILEMENITVVRVGDYFNANSLISADPWARKRYENRVKIISMICTTFV